VFREQVYDLKLFSSRFALNVKLIFFNLAFITVFRAQIIHFVAAEAN